MVDFITPQQALPLPVTRYKWQNHSLHPCHDCAKLDGQVRTLSEWSYVHQHKHCHCSLEPVEQQQDGVAFNPSIQGGQFVSNIDGSKSTLVKCPTDSPLHPDNLNAT